MLSKTVLLCFRRVLAIMLAVFLVLAPNVAMAFDLEKGAEDTLGLVKKIVIIAVLLAAIWTFFKRELVAAVVIIVVGALLLAMTTPGLMESVGKGIVNLLGGGTS